MKKIFFLLIPFFILSCATTNKREGVEKLSYKIIYNITSSGEKAVLNESKESKTYTINNFNPLKNLMYTNTLLASLKDSPNSLEIDFKNSSSKRYTLVGVVSDKKFETGKVNIQNYDLPLVSINKNDTENRYIVIFQDEFKKYKIYAIFYDGNKDDFDKIKVGGLVYISGAFNNIAKINNSRENNIVVFNWCFTINDADIQEKQ